MNTQVEREREKTTDYATRIFQILETSSFTPCSSDVTCVNAIFSRSSRSKSPLTFRSTPSSVNLEQHLSALPFRIQVFTSVEYKGEYARTGGIIEKKWWAARGSERQRTNNSILRYLRLSSVTSVEMYIFAVAKNLFILSECDVRVLKLDHVFEGEPCKLLSQKQVEYKGG